MDLYNDALELHGRAKHAPEAIDPAEVRAFTHRVRDHLDLLRVVLDTSTGILLDEGQLAVLDREAPRVGGVAKYAPDQLDTDDVRRLSMMVEDHFSDLGDALEEATVTLTGHTLWTLLDRG